MMDIYRLYKKVPGGMLIVPMLIFAVINTLFPTLWTSLGDMSQHLFKSGTLAFAGLILFASGTAMDVKTLGIALKRCSVLMTVKVLIGVGFGIAFMKAFGLDGIWGINAVAFIVCITSANPGIFMSLIQDYGEKADMGNFAVLNIVTAPAVPVIVIASASGGGIDPLAVVSVLLPFVLGMILGNIDPNYANVYRAAMPVALPFLGACFGSSLNLITAAKSGMSGVLLAIVYLLIHSILVLADKMINRRPGYCAVAMSSVAGITLIVPYMLDPAVYGAYINEAIPPIAMCILLTSIISPYLTKFAVKIWGSPKCPLTQGEANA